MNFRNYHVSSKLETVQDYLVLLVKHKKVRLIYSEMLSTLDAVVIFCRFMIVMYIYDKITPFFKIVYSKQN